MTSRHEMSQYAQQGDSDQWAGLPANGEGFDKPSSVDGEYLAAAMRLRRYNNEPLEHPDKWCDLYDTSQQYGNDLALLADFACEVILGKDGGE